MTNQVHDFLLIGTDTYSIPDCIRIHGRVSSPLRSIPRSSQPSLLRRLLPSWLFKASVSPPPEEAVDLDELINVGAFSASALAGITWEPPSYVCSSNRRSYVAVWEIKAGQLWLRDFVAGASLQDGPIMVDAFTGSISPADWDPPSADNSTLLVQRLCEFCLQPGEPGLAMLAAAFQEREQVDALLASKQWVRRLDQLRETQMMAPEWRSALEALLDQHVPRDACQRLIDQEARELNELMPNAMELAQIIKRTNLSPIDVEANLLHKEHPTSCKLELARKLVAQESRIRSGNSQALDLPYWDPRIQSLVERLMNESPGYQNPESWIYECRLRPAGNLRAIHLENGSVVDREEDQQ